MSTNPPPRPKYDSLRPQTQAIVGLTWSSVNKRDLGEVFRQGVQRQIVVEARNIRGILERIVLRQVGISLELGVGTVHTAAQHGQNSDVASLVAVALRMGIKSRIKRILE